MSLERILSRSFRFGDHKSVTYEEQDALGVPHWLVAIKYARAMHGYLFYNPCTDTWHESKLDARIYETLESAQAQVLLLKLSRSQS